MWFKEEYFTFSLDGDSDIYFLPFIKLHVPALLFSQWTEKAPTDLFEIKKRALLWYEEKYMVNWTRATDEVEERVVSTLVIARNIFLANMHAKATIDIC